MPNFLVRFRMQLPLSVFLLMMLLVACAPVTPLPVSPSPTSPITETAPTPSPPSPTPTVTSEAANVPSPPATGTFTLASEQVSNLPGVPAGITEEGAPYRGFADAAVTMVEYADFQCPFCRRHFQETQPILDQEYIATGRMRHVFKNFPLRQIHPQADGAAQAALCAGVQGQFWPMHDILFARQEEWADQEDAAQRFRGYAEELGLDMEAYDACWAAQPFTNQIQRELEEGLARGVRGTPAFFINGWFVEGAQPVDVFRDIIERAARGETPTPTPTPTYAEQHPFDPNPETPGRTYWGDAYIGAEDAPIVIVEVSDLFCPYCRLHHTTVWPEFKTRYVDTGRVRVIFKHLLGHENSGIAAEAAECAGNQGQLFPYVDLLYERAEEWTELPVEEMTATFKAYAQELGLNTEAFNTCLDTREMQEKVLADHQAMVQAGVQGTPTFIILVNDQIIGQVPGFIPLERWEEVMAQVDEILQSMETP